MKALSTFAAAAAALSLGAVALPASAATLISFGTATPKGSPSLQYQVGAGGVGGTLTGIGNVLWSFDEVLDDADNLGPINTTFSFSATSNSLLGTSGGVTGVAGFAGSFSFTYNGPDKSYDWYGLTRTLKAGDVLLAATFTNAWLQGTGAGSFNASTIGGVPATFSSVTSDVFNFANASDFDFNFGLTGVKSSNAANGGPYNQTGLQVTADGNGFKSFQSGSNASFSAGAIPEPGTWALMIIGFGGAGAMIRRRRAAFA